MLKRVLIIFLVIALSLIAIIGWADHWVTSSTQGQLYSSVDIIPKNKVGLVLGTAKYLKKGVINPYYQYRIDAAVELFKAGKIEYILISGDNSSLHYNEPRLIKSDLVARGVPPDKIFEDYAGLRTLDSILRCRDIFGEDHFTIISQAFHNERALFIANHKNINAIAYNARDADDNQGVKIREKLARVKMLIDLLLNKQAKYYYGEKIEIK